jgi:biotin carboxyl carrier protein
VRFEASVGGKLLRVEVRRADGRYEVTVDGRRHEIDWVEDGAFTSLLVAGRSFDVGIERREDGYRVSFDGQAHDVQLQAAGLAGAAARHAPGPSRVVAPMPGKIVRLLVGEGDAVAPGQGLVVMEAMKMENELRATRGGTVRELRVAEGQAVETGALLVLVE